MEDHRGTLRRFPSNRPACGALGHFVLTTFRCLIVAVLHLLTQSLFIFRGHYLWKIVLSLFFFHFSQIACIFSLLYSLHCVLGRLDVPIDAPIPPPHSSLYHYTPVLTSVARKAYCRRQEYTYPHSLQNAASFN